VSEQIEGPLHIEDVATFAARAGQWLRSVRPPRKAGTRHWGEGEFDVTVFHDLEPEVELALLAEHVAWHHEKLDAGFGAIAAPVEYGGAGLTPTHDRAFTELEAGYDVPNDHELFAVTTHLVAPTIAVYGTPEQKERFVRRFLRADEFCCQLFSEPGAGSDLAGLATRAVRDGDHWVLDGQKVWTSNARISPWGLAICRTDPDVPKHAGLTAFLVPIPSPGLEVRPIKQMNGGASFNEVFFDHTSIADELRIGPVGDGWKVALTVLGFERETSGSSGRRGGDFQDLLGLARAMNRTDEPAVRQDLAGVYTRERNLEWTRARTAAEAAAAQRAVGPEGSVEKLLWTQSMTAVSAVAGRLLGAALTADTGEWGTFAWNDHVLGAPGYRIAGGSDEIQRNIIGERVLGLPSEPRVDRDIPFSKIKEIAALSGR
jgi:alkylation response protein AidB-like acyl-CoA dehydrogenase